MNTEVSIIERAMPVLATGAQILQQNQQSSIAAANACYSFIGKVTAAGGMTVELDTEANNLLVKIRKTGELMKERRAEFTTTMDLIKKEFTAQENAIDPKKEGTAAASIQAMRNKFAADQAAETERRRIEAERKQAADQERINVASDIAMKLSQWFGSSLLEAKQNLNRYFNQATLTTLDNVTATISNERFAYKPTTQFTYQPTYRIQYLGHNDVVAMVNEAIARETPEAAAMYTRQMDELRHQLLEAVPAKRQELESIAEMEREQERLRKEEEARRAEMAKADAARREQLEREQRAAEERAAAARAEQQRIEAERRRREEEEAEKLRQQQGADRQAQEAKIEADKAAATTMSLFEMAESQGLTQTPAAARQGYSIEVTHQAGWMLITNLWFQKEAPTTALDKFGKVSLDRMKSFAEKHAHKTGEKIVSPYIKYTEEFTAINKKAA